MKRLIALSVLLVFGSVAYADYEMSDSQKQKYRDWLRSLDTFYTGALAIAPNGCWYADGGGTRSQAKRAALKSCKKHCKSDACKVVDVNGTSAFIKQRGSSSSSSTASSSDKLWCATSTLYPYVR
jgi:Tfp pilus assembly protein PilV